MSELPEQPKNVEQAYLAQQERVIAQLANVLSEPSAFSSMSADLPDPEYGIVNLAAYDNTHGD